MEETHNVPQEIDALRTDLIWTRHYYNQYKKLYMSGDLRIRLLNETAPGFFRLVQDMLWDEMIVRVSRLTDPYKKGSDENLSIFMLPKLIENNSWGFGNDITPFLLEIKDASSSIRKRRNKLVVHRDLSIALSEGAVSKPELQVTLDQINIILELIGKALNVIYINLLDTMQSWDLVAAHDAGEIVHYLKTAMIFKENESKDTDWLKRAEEWNNSKYRNA